MIVHAASSTYSHADEATPPMRRALLWTVMVAFVTACGGEPTLDTEGVAPPLGPQIAGGQPEPDLTSVVSVLDTQQLILCTGSLIAPNAVLTARHCIAPFGSASIVCNQTSFGAEFPASPLSISTEPVVDMDTGGYGVSEILVPSDSDFFCGADMAILLLDESIPAAEAEPMPVRLDEPILSGEAYAAVGFGGTDDNGTEGGVRRRLDMRTVECVGTPCNGADGPPVEPNEFRGTDGICVGDSGGPAIDETGVIIGVTSRGLDGCAQPVYGSTFGYADFIRDGGMAASGLGGYAPPAWAQGSDVDPNEWAPIGKPCADASECSTGLCVGDVGESFCSRPCAQHECPAGYLCGAQAVCERAPKDDVGIVPPPPKDRDDCSCALVGARRSAPSPLVFLMAGLFVLRRRRIVGAPGRTLFVRPRPRFRRLKDCSVVLPPHDELVSNAPANDATRTARGTSAGRAEPARVGAARIGAVGRKGKPPHASST